MKFCFEALESTKISSYEPVSSEKYENGYRTKICNFTVYTQLKFLSISTPPPPPPLSLSLSVLSASCPVFLQPAFTSFLFAVFFPHTEAHILHFGTYREHMIKFAKL